MFDGSLLSALIATRRLRGIHNGEGQVHGPSKSHLILLVAGARLADIDALIFAEIIQLKARSTSCNASL
jgi:hypothetical protein